MWFDHHIAVWKIQCGKTRNSLPRKFFSVKSICSKVSSVVKRLFDGICGKNTLCRAVEKLPRNFFRQIDLELSSLSNKVDLTEFLRQNRGSKIP